MNKVSQTIYACLMVILICSCTSRPVPVWKTASVTHLEHFKTSYLTGDDTRASRAFSRAVAEIKTSGNITVLARAYLIQCAVKTAALETSLCSNYKQLVAHTSDVADRNFSLFLQSNLDHVSADVLPGRYRPFFHALREGSIEDINATIGTIADPLSRLIASGVSVAKRRYDLVTLQRAAETASEQGWKRALVAYLEQMKRLYERTGESIKADKLQQQITIITNND